MRGLRILFTASIATCALALACGGGSSGGGTSGGGPSGGGTSGGDDATLAGRLQTLHGAAIYFGHNSVGWNIVGGLGGVLDEQADPKPRVVETDQPGDVSAGVFAHSGIGGNGAPAAKIASFQNLMTGALGGKVDLAFMKFCFVDFTDATWDDPAKVDALLATYQQMVSAVHAAHPALKIVHVTVPLSPGDDVNNARRERISQELRDLYGSDVFDLARIESTDPTTHQRITGANGPRLYSGWKGDDSGHLNAAGSRAIALELIAFLAGKR